MIRFPKVNPTVDGIWREHYNSHTGTLTKGMTICVNWRVHPDERGYGVSFLDRRLVDRFDDLAEAKRAGLRLARKVLNDAIAKLDELEGK